MPARFHLFLTAVLSSALLSGCDPGHPEDPVKPPTGDPGAARVARAKKLLAEAGFPDAAKSLDQEMVGAAAEALVSHLEAEGDLLSKAVDQGLIAA